MQGAKVSNSWAAAIQGTYRAQFRKPQWLSEQISNTHFTELLRTTEQLVSIKV